MGRGLLTLLCCLSCRPHSPPARPPDAASNEVTIPAAQADSREALPLEVHSVRAGEKERVYLQAGGGTALLELGPAHAPAGEATFGGFGDCTLSAVSAEAGAPVVARVAAWLEVADTPALERRPLEPARCSFVLLGDGRDPSGKTWTVYKLFFGDDNEIYLRLAPDRSRAELLEKDTDYRRGVVAFLGRALRDGPPPPPAGPRIDSQPFLGEVRPVDGVGAYAGWGAYRFAIAWIGEQLISTNEGDDQTTKILRWSRIDGPPRQVATIDGVVYVLRLDPAARRLAVEAEFPARKGILSGGDPMGLLVVDLAGGKVTLLRKIERPVPLNVRWSPDGRSLAFALPWPELGAPEHELTVVCDAATGKEMARAKLDVHPIRWDGDGLLLGDGSDPGVGKVRYLWAPGKSEPKPLKMPLTAPLWEHGGHRVQVVGSSLAVDDSQGSRRLEPSDDPKAILALRESSPMWLGEHFLGVGEWVVDLRSMRQRRLSRAENLRLVGSSPSGRIALVHDRDQPMRWARVK